MNLILRLMLYSYVQLKFLGRAWLIMELAGAGV